MRKTVFVLCACLAAASVWAAESTCETRVDAHQHATTSQRVAYCLTPSYDNTVNNPGLVFSGVTFRRPATAEEAQRPTARNGHFKQENVSVTQNFVETRQFPKLTDGRVSEQEIWAQRRAEYQGQQMAAQLANNTKCDLQEETTSSVMKETPAGLRARSKKPGRRLKAVSVAQDESSVLEPETTQEVVPMAADYTYDEYGDGANTQPYAPAALDAQEYVPADSNAQPYVPYTPAGQEEIPVGTSTYAPAN